MLTIFAIPNGKNGVIAQLVEQRTENPCVPGSIPGDTTSKRESYRNVTLFFFSIIIYSRTLEQIFRYNCQKWLVNSQ